MQFVDTHTHNYDSAYADCCDEVIQRAQEAGVRALLQADVDSSERANMFALCDKHPGVLYPMLGLYPGSVDNNWQSELDAMLQWKDRKVVAVGEIGLDYHYGKDFIKEQQEVFRIQLELAAQWDLPVNIHLRDATEDMLKILADCRHLHLRGNLHAFGHSYEVFERVQKLGDWYVGIGGVVTFKKASIGEDIKRIPLSRVILETDSPYLTPTPHRGERNESSYIPLIAQFIAQQKGISLEEVARVTTENAVNIFGI